MFPPSRRFDQYRVGAGCSADPSRKKRRPKADGQHAGSRNGLMYVLSMVRQWRPALEDFHAKGTIAGYLDLYTNDGILDPVHHAPYVLCRGLYGCEASPTTAVIDSPSVKRAEKQERLSIQPASFGRCRRLAKDWECMNRKGLAFLTLASIRTMLESVRNLRL